MPSSRKVLRVVTRLNVGGPARHCVLLTDGLVSRGWDTTLAVGALEADEAPLLAGDPGGTPGGAEIVRVPGLRSRPSPPDDLRALAALVGLVRRVRPDVVHTHMSKAGALGRVAAALVGVPAVVHTFHGHVLSGYFGPLGGRAVAWAERGLAALSDALVTLSPALRDELAGVHRIAPPERFRIVPLGRDLAPFRAAPTGRLRAELGAPDALLVGLVGRLAPIKAAPLAVAAFARAAAQTPGARLVVVGDGPERAAVEAAARAHGVADRVHLLGWRREDLPAVVRDLDLIVSSSRNEGTPLSLIEAFAAGVPAVATRVGGVPDMFGPPSLASVGRTVPLGVELRGEGALVAPDDPAALGAALALLLGDDALRAAAGARARARSATWDAPRLLDDVDALYRELLGAGPEVAGGASVAGASRGAGRAARGWRLARALARGAPWAA